MESIKEHPNYLPDYFGPCKDHQIDLHEIMNFDDLRSFFWFCPVFRILLNCPFFEKRKNRSYPTIDHFFPLLSPPTVTFFLKTKPLLNKIFFLKTNFYEPTVFSAHWEGSLRKKDLVRNRSTNLFSVHVFGSTLECFSVLQKSSICN